MVSNSRGVLAPKRKINRGTHIKVRQDLGGSYDSGSSED